MMSDDGEKKAENKKGNARFPLSETRDTCIGRKKEIEAVKKERERGRETMNDRNNK